MGNEHKKQNKTSQLIYNIYWQLESYISETKRKQTEIFDYKKRLADAETKYRQHQSLFDTVRVERNLCNRSLVEAQEQVRDLKSKLKITSQQIEQLKEDIAIKEANLVKEEFRKSFQFNILDFDNYYILIYTFQSECVY